MPEVIFRNVRKAYADGTVAVADLNLTIANREFLCVLGPSGCGKSSTLRMLAGLEPVTFGDILLDGVRINELPPQHRDMAMVFENYALYPHLTVFENIAMPLVARGVARSEIRQRVHTVAETLQIIKLLRRRPYQLSGGERQRVAVGRAIIRQPSMFLMDEPLGHLEAYLRVQLRAEIRRLHERQTVTTVHITHDQEEAAAVSDRIAVLNAGRLQQLGTLRELLDGPANRFVAEFIGMPPINLLPAVLERVDDGLALRVGEGVMSLSPSQSARLQYLATGESLTLGIRPQDVEIAPDGGAGALAGQVALLEPQGDRSVIIAETSVGRVSAMVPSERAPRPNAPLRYRFKSTRAHLFSADGRNLLGSHA